MSVKPYFLKNGEVRYKVYVNVRSRKNRRKRIQKYEEGFLTEKSAMARQKELRDDAQRAIGFIDGIGLLWGDVLVKYKIAIDAGTVGINIKTAEDYLGGATKWTSSWALIPAAELSQADGEDVIESMNEEGKKSSYKVKIKKSISAIFKWGVKKRFIPSNIGNPMEDVIIPKGMSKPPNTLSAYEANRLLVLAKEFNHPWYSVWFTALHTGMRSGELKALSFKNIDFEKNVIILADAMKAGTNIVGDPKPRYWRTIPISEPLRLLLLDIYQKCNDKQGFVFPRLPDWMNNKQSQCLRMFLEANGLKSVCFHSLRATWATQMLHNGIPKTVIMEIGGWKDVETFNIYIKLAGTDIQGATNVLKYGVEADFMNSVKKAIEKSYT